MNKIFSSIVLGTAVGLSFLVKAEDIEALETAANPVNFSIAQIPDTQSYFMEGHRDQHAPRQVLDMYRWLLHDQQKGTKYVYIAHVGDIIDKGGSLDKDDWFQTDNEWRWANEVFTEIESLMNNQNFIPIGFALGNHDLPNKQGDPHGNAIYSEETVKHNMDNYAYGFLKKRYEKQKTIGVNHEYLSDNYLNLGDKPNYLTSVYRFSINQNDKKTKFIILNVPFGITNSSDGMSQINSLLKENKDSLVILICHTPNAFGTQNNHIQEEIIKQHKNIFMVLYGHVPAGVGPDGNYDTITSSHIQPQDIYVYRFDYQSDGKSNLPQLPILRTYDFTLSGNTLSWNANDVVAWFSDEISVQSKTFNPIDQIYSSTFGYSIGQYGWSRSINFNNSKKLVETQSIQISNHIDGPVPPQSCIPPINDNQSEYLNGSVHLEWQPAVNAVAYKVYDYQGKGGKFLSEVNVSNYSEKVGNPGILPSGKLGYVYQVASVCVDGAGKEQESAELLKIEVETKPNPPKVCSAPKTLKRSDYQNGKVYLQWLPVSDAVAYRVYDYQGKSGRTLAKVTDPGYSESVGNPGGLPSGKSGYLYQVASVCRDEAGKEQESPELLPIEVEKK